MTSSLSQSAVKPKLWITAQPKHLSQNPTNIAMTGSGLKKLSNLAIATSLVLILSFLLCLATPTQAYSLSVPDSEQGGVVYKDSLLDSPLDYAKRSSAMHFYKRSLEDLMPEDDSKRSSPWHIGKRSSPWHIGKRSSPWHIGKRSSAMHFFKRNPYEEEDQLNDMFY